MKEKQTKVLQKKRAVPFEEEVLNIEEVAKLLRVSKPVIYHLVRDKKIPGFLAGNKWRFSKRAILEAVYRGEDGKK